MLEFLRNFKEFYKCILIMLYWWFRILHGVNRVVSKMYKGWLFDSCFLILALMAASSLQYDTYFYPIVTVEKKSPFAPIEHLLIFKILKIALPKILLKIGYIFDCLFSKLSHSEAQLFLIK